jgi:hypothetical protein
MQASFAITLAVPKDYATVQVILDAIAKCIPSDFISDVTSSNRPFVCVLSRWVTAVDRPISAFLVFSQGCWKSES